MTARDNEAEIMALLAPMVKSYCKWKWTCIEMEDRVSEANIVLLIVMRTRGIPEEDIWPVFLQVLPQRMQPLNRLEGWHRYRCRSLDARVRLRDGSQGPALHELLPDSDSDFDRIWEEQISGFAS